MSNDINEMLDVSEVVAENVLLSNDELKLCEDIKSSIVNSLKRSDTSIEQFADEYVDAHNYIFGVNKELFVISLYVLTNPEKARELAIENIIKSAGYDKE